MRTPRTVRSPHSPNDQAFTLIELMVAISVLAILCSLVLQLMSSTTRLTSGSRQFTDCDTEARYALDQISADLAHRIRRPDVDSFVDKALGNDRFYIFAEAPGYAPDLDPTLKSNISLVGYRVHQVGNSFALQRYARALPWQGDQSSPGMPFVVLGTDKDQTPVYSTTLLGTFPKLASDDTSEDNFYQTIGENIVRFEVCLIKKPDLTTTPPTPASLLVAGDEISTELNRFGLTRISSIVVTIAVLDPQSAKQLQPESVKTFVNSANFDAQKADTLMKLPLEEWNHEFMSQSATLLKPLKQGLHFYQRVINL